MKINFLGDSITVGIGASNYKNSYVNLIGNELDITVQNYGVGGSRFARQSKASSEAIWDYDFQMRMRFMAEVDGDADFVFIFGGTNDYGHGDAIIGEKEDVSSRTFYGALNNIILYLTEKFGKEKLCFLLPLPRYNQDNVYGDVNHKKMLPSISLKGYVDVIEERLKFYGIDYIDLFHNFLPIPQTNTPDTYFVDGLHPNDNGHLLIAEKVIEYLRRKG
jgi:lysophospholipase L1-like esterase